MDRGRITVSLAEYEEGAVRFYASDLEELERLGLAYTKARVFYNPDMRSNRDIAVAVASLLGEEVVAADIMAASGVRALRLAAEAGAAVIANDRNPLAYHAIRLGIRRNGLEGSVDAWLMDANLASLSLKESGGVDYLDVDPFGTPSPFLWAAVGAVRIGGILAVTATDTPVLYGVYPDKLFRVYFAHGRKVEFHKEAGLRILAAYAARVAAVYDLAVRPVLAHATRHYARVYFRVERGATKASESLREMLGWVSYCLRCGWRMIQQGRYPPKEESCPRCGSRLEKLGPLWVGDILDEGVVKPTLKKLNECVWFSEEAREIVESLSQELGMPPLYYDLDLLASRRKLPSPSPRAAVKALRSRGFRASLVHCEKKSIKTDASIGEIEEVVRDLVGGK